MNDDKLDYLLKEAVLVPGGITVLTGAGISAESQIPTFRGPEGYWTIGSQVYQPQEMATNAMFQKNPKAVWQWYLYRMAICQNAEPNPGHWALVDLEKSLPDRFTLITQNVDNLHLRAGQSTERTFQIHGNIFFVHCSELCRQKIYPMPVGITGKAKHEPLTKEQWRLLQCPDCGGLLRPHVLWFDEAYNETFYRFASSLAAARNTALLIVVGTSGATNLPNQVAAEVYHHGGIIIDINIEANPFGRLAQSNDRGLSIRQPSGTALPLITRKIKAILST